MNMLRSHNAKSLRRSTSGPLAPVSGERARARGRALHGTPVGAFLLAACCMLMARAAAADEPAAAKSIKTERYLGADTEPLPEALAA